jgi:phage tail sheath protein FI
MAAIPGSPAVVFLEKDNSAYPPNIESSIVGIVGYASKGPTNEATLITSQENLLNTFGKPSESLQGQGLEGALEILETTNQIRFVRAVPATAKNASAIVSFGVCPAIQFSANPSKYGVSSNIYLRVSVRDSQGVLVLEDQDYYIPSSTANINAGLSQASAIAKIIGTGASKTDHLGVFFDTATEGTGFLVGAYPGKLASLIVKSYSTTAFTDGVGLTSFSGVSVSGGLNTSVASSITAYGADVTTTSLSYVVQSQYPGTGYNLSTVPITGQIEGLSVEIESNGGPKALVSINNEGAIAETFNTSLLNDTTFIETVINIGTDNPTSDYIKGEIYYGGIAVTGALSPLTNFVNVISSLGAGVTAITVVTNSEATDAGAPRFVKLKDGTYNLAGGTNGTMTSNGVIGDTATKTGIYALDDDLLNISIGIVPGIYDDSVQNALITLAETSQNFIAVVSPPMALDTVQDATEWMNGRASDLSRTAAINSSWASVFWPWVQVFDVFSAKDRWYDPAIFAVRQMAFTDNVAETWFAPAGFRRGRLTKPTATEMPLNQGDRDALYTNNINPVVNFTPEGITIFGQKTAQRAATALDRINVRRLMIFLRKVLLQTGRQDLFEPNDAFTWEIVKDKAEALLADIQARRGITDFRVICDETVNTPLRVDRNELWCKILLKPTKTAEWIVFEVNLTNQAAKFSG